MNTQRSDIPESLDRNEQEDSTQKPGTRSDEIGIPKSGSIGCLASFVLMVVLLIVPKAIALWQGRHSDGTWIYPPIGLFVFWLLTFSTLLTGRIPYRHEDLDLRDNPLLWYSAVATFALAACAMYALYLAVVFGW